MRSKEQPILIWMLAVAFIHLKLSGAIVWSWVWVLSPIWGYFTVTVLVGIVLGIFAGTRAIRGGERN